MHLISAGRGILENTNANKLGGYSQGSLFEFVIPDEIERAEIPTDEQIKQILTLGLLSTFTNKYERASDRNKAAETLGKLCGLFVDKKQIDHNVFAPKGLNDFYNE